MSALPKESFSQQCLQADIEQHLRAFFDAHEHGQLPPPGLHARVMPLIEKPLIEMTLRAAGGNQLKTAQVLGINRNTLRKKIALLGIDIAALTEQA